ncbi:MAG: hypothetical protein MTP17_03045 [Candidatus Midichloria sp.]|nr:MAG: hypothetical protein MTP17_03045 [Candidatus Midichloria sp.]
MVFHIFPEHNHANLANSILSLNQLSQTLPNIKWWGPVISWVANSLDISRMQNIASGLNLKIAL